MGSKAHELPAIVKIIPLPDPTTHMRLLQLDISDDGGLIGASLSTALIDEAPEYIAISYAWGDPALHRVLSIDSRTTALTANCWFMLQQLSRRRIVGHVWVDAVCIDQTNYAEKSAQVMRMHTIFKGATEVLISLGPEGEQDPEHASLILDYTAQIVKGNVLADSYYEMRVENLSALNDARHWLANLKYWKRLWIVQELVNSGQARLLLLDESLSLEHARTLCSATLTERATVTDSLLRQASKPRVWDGDLEKSDLALHHAPMQRVMKLARPGTTWVDRSLFNVIEGSASQSCSNSKDHVFAVLSFVERPSHLPPFPVDYSMTVRQLAILVLDGMVTEYHKRSAACVILEKVGHLITILGVPQRAEHLYPSVTCRRLKERCAKRDAAWVLSFYDWYIISEWNLAATLSRHNCFGKAANKDVVVRTIKLGDILVEDKDGFGIVINLRSLGDKSSTWTVVDTYISCSQIPEQQRWIFDEPKPLMITFSSGQLLDLVLLSNRNPPCGRQSRRKRPDI